MVSDRLIGEFEDRASRRDRWRDHPPTPAQPAGFRARKAWFDGEHNLVLMLLTDGRVIGAEPSLIGGLQFIQQPFLSGLHASDDGAWIVIDQLEVRLSVHKLAAKLFWTLT